MTMMSPRRRVLPSTQKSDVVDDIVVATKITLSDQNAGKEHQGGREKRREKRRRHPQSRRPRRSSFSAFLVVWGDFFTFVVGVVIR